MYGNCVTQGGKGVKKGQFLRDVIYGRLLLIHVFLGIPFTHIASPMPEMYRKNKIVPRGVANRRAALNWIKNVKKPGVLYFGDDDNTFDLKLFSEIRDTKKVSMFPVGLIGDYAISSPVVKNVCKTIIFIMAYKYYKLSFY